MLLYPQGLKLFLIYSSQLAQPWWTRPWIPTKKITIPPRLLVNVWFRPTWFPPQLITNTRPMGTVTPTQFVAKFGIGSSFQITPNWPPTNLARLSVTAFLSSLKLSAAQPRSMNTQAALNSVFIAKWSKRTTGFALLLQTTHRSNTNKSLSDFPKGKVSLDVQLYQKGWTTGQVTER